MAIVQHYDKPDLFITMTRSAVWPDILSELLPGQTAQDHPCLIARVFKLKTRTLLHDLRKDVGFSKIVSYIYVVEFQNMAFLTPIFRWADVTLRVSYSYRHQLNSVCAVSAQSDLTELLCSTSLIIWDEISSKINIASKQLIVLCMTFASVRNGSEGYLSYSLVMTTLLLG
jgi:hypothetical protein